MGKEVLRNIRNWLFRNGRHLEVALWNYHFEDGSSNEVLKALSVYQNRDGGFGHGIEPDIQMPYSDNISTSAAVHILKDIGFPPESERIISGILKFLKGNSHQNFIPVPESVMEFPHAEHWDTEFLPSFGINPAAELNGFIYRFSKNSDEKQTALKNIGIIWNKVSEKTYKITPHELSSLILMDELTGPMDSFNNAENYIKEKTTELIDSEISSYNTENYYTPPSLFIEGRKDRKYSENKKITDWYAKYLEESVNPQGYWDPNWTWGKYKMDSLTLNQWRSVLTVRNMLFLQRMKPHDLIITDRI